MKTQHQVKRDANHVAIETVFRKMLADHVTDSSRWGDGAGDLFVSFGDACRFIEIKTKDGKLTAAQVAFQARHPQCVVECRTVDDAVAICHSIRRTQC